MRILAFTRYQRLGSSSRVRFYQYFPYLQSKGVEIVNAPFFDDEYVRNLYKGKTLSLRVALKAYIIRLATLRRKNSFDLIWVEKEFLPWFPAIMEVLFRTSNVPYVVDYDDAVFHRYDLHTSPIVRAFLSKKIDHVMHDAALVIAGNEYLAARAMKAEARRVEILPSVVDVKRYPIKQHKQDSAFAIGWIGTPVTGFNLRIIYEALSKLNEETMIKLILVGAGSAQQFAEITTETIPWSEDIELTVNQKFDVGIMPLIDGPFERGKCGYKLIQYMAGGLPVVASPVGVNQQIVEHEINGYLANSTEDWINYLRTLRDNSQKRKAMGAAGRQKVEQLYNLQVTAPKLLELLINVANVK